MRTAQPGEGNDAAPCNNKQPNRKAVAISGMASTFTNTVLRVEIGDNGEIMPRRYFRKYLPAHGKIREHRMVRIFGDLLHDPNLWHLNRRSVAGAASIGLFWAFIPMAPQMLPAAAMAIWLRVNLPLSMALVWISNPLTMPVIFWACYRIGAWILGHPTGHFRDNFEPSLGWLLNEIGTIWQPLLLGSLLVASLAALFGNLLVRLLWRLYVIRYWRRRKRPTPP